MSEIKKRLVLCLLIVGILTGSFGQQGSGGDDYQYALIEAVKQKNLGNIQEAVKLYRLVIQSKPDCAVAHYELGSIYLMAGEKEEALEKLGESYNLDPKNHWYTVGYLAALGAVEEYGTMESVLKEKMRLEPQEVEWEFQMASVQYAKEKYKRAVKILEDIEQERGFSEKVTLLKASVYESKEEYDLARAEIERVMELFPEAVQFRVVAAELSMKSGNEDDAAEYYHQILLIDSTNIFALTNLTDYYRKRGDYVRSFDYLAHSFRSRLIEPKRKLAILAYYLSDDEIVKKYSSELDRILQVFLQEHPDEPEGRLMATDFYIDRKDYERAFQQLKIYLEEKRGNYQMYMQAILLANAASLNDQLISVTEEALKLFPDSTDIRFFRGIGLYELSQYEKVVENFQSVSLDGFSEKEYAFQSRMLYAEALYRLEDFGRSDSLFESMINEDPENHMVLNNYSYYLAERGEKLKLAEQWSKKTILENPDNATFLDTYAWVLFRLQDYKGAEKYIMRALEKGGESDPEVNEHAGDIQAALGSYRLAEAYYRKAIILGGEKERIEGKLEMTSRNVDE